MRRTGTITGATLLEILVAMIVIGMVATGMITAFIFSRQLTWRSSTELSAAALVTDMAEALRGAVNGPLSNGLTLAPGVYVDDNMPNPPAGAVTLHPAGGGPNPLDFPAEFLRFQSPTSGVAGATVAAANHGDGRMVIVEDVASGDLDGDGQTGVSFNPPGTVNPATHLRRVRIRVKWTSPTS